MRICCLPVIISISLTGCQDDFLSAKPDKTLIVPSTLSDFQSLLDNSTNVINRVPSLNENATDDFYTTDEGLVRVANNAEYEREIYIFSREIDYGVSAQDWDIPYQQIFYANVILDGLAGLDPGASTATYNSIKGSALFIRAFAQYNLAQQFAKPYTAARENTDLGVPIRLTADITTTSVRPTLKATYDQIIEDLIEAEELLPDQVTLKTRPSKAAAQAMLARVYLNMGIHDRAGYYANICLDKSGKLIDYNSLSSDASKPLPLALPNGNDEVIYFAATISSFYGISSLTSVDSVLYQSYNDNDLRKVMFFRNRGNNIYTFKGTYSGDLPLFGGLATDEVILIRSECYARAGDTERAMRDLNMLLTARWSNKVDYPTLYASDSNSALKLILAERRKELIGRCLRWSDLRRLNQDPELAVTVIHTNNGKSYSLAPNDSRYVFPIPNNEITINGLVQNER